MTRHSISMVTSVFIAVTLITTVTAQIGERLSDKDVGKLFEAVDHGRDRFEDQLDGKLKRPILRGPRGEVNVEEFLDDLKRNARTFATDSARTMPPARPTASSSNRNSMI